jgi:hypothetical protein
VVQSERKSRERKERTKIEGRGTRLHFRLDMNFPNLKISASFFVAMSPQLDIVPRQPQSPRKNEHHVQPNGGGEAPRAAVH